mmetsp:Transcript_913/g.2092  ORF Transcript_913/g.2092 Transcript_913/m.2092 type:complete len:108 (-) Transcript_913:547-870(-)
MMRLLSSRAGSELCPKFDEDEFDDEAPASSALDSVDELIAFTNGCHVAMQESPQLLPMLGLAPPQEGVGSQLSAEEAAALHQMLSAGVAKGKAAALSLGVSVDVAPP